MCYRQLAMKVAVNAISAKTGGAVTYLQNMLPELARRLSRTGDVVVWRADAPTADDSWPRGVDYRRDAALSGGLVPSGTAAKRLWFDQVALPRTLRRERFDVLFSSANFGSLRPPCRQVLLVRNAAYFDETFLGRIKSSRIRAVYAAQRWLTMRSIAAADITLFPTQGMLDLVARYWRGSHEGWRVAHYGTRHDLFAPRGVPAERATTTVLNVGMYSDQKNLGTLLRAVEILARAEPKRYELKLTAGFHQDWLGASPYFPNFRAEQDAFRRLEGAGVAADVEWKKYGSLPELYASADIFVFPSYIESFGHPVVEAMAAGLPVIAADVPVNRELCGDAALYFPAFDAEACANEVRRVAHGTTLRERLREAGLRRAATFTWQRHVDGLLDAMTTR